MGRSTDPHVPKYLRPLVKELRSQGWDLNFSNGKHVRLVSPEGRVVITSASPSENRTIRNLRAQLRRYGADV